MKIIHVCSHFNTTIEYQELALVKQQTKDGHNVVIITGDYHFNFPNYEESYKSVLGNRFVGTGVFIESGFKIIRLKSFNRPSFLFHLRGLRKELKKENPDAIICHGFELGILPIQAMKHNIPTIIDSHYVKLHQKQYDFPRNFMHWILRLVKKLMVKTLQNIALVGVTEESVDYLYENTKVSSKIQFIPLGVDNKVFYFDDKIRLATRNSLKLKADEVLLCYSGKVEEYKGIHLILKALNKTDNQKIKLLIVGNGSLDYKNKLFKLIREYNLFDQVVFKSFCDKTQLNNYYNASDIAVFPLSITMSHLEAAAVRLPIIVEHMRAAEHRLVFCNGFTVKPHRIDDLVKKITSLTIDTNLRKEMGLKGEKLVLEKYTWEKINCRFMGLIKELHQKLNVISHQ